MTVGLCPSSCRRAAVLENSLIIALLLPEDDLTIERDFRPFVLDCRDITLSFGTKLTLDRIGEFAVGLDVLLARDRVSRGVVDRAGVAKQFTEDVVDEVAEGWLNYPERE
jgi:hypothetical protein